MEQVEMETINQTYMGSCKTIKLNGKYGVDKVALVDSDDFKYLSQWKWAVNKHGYVLRFPRVIDKVKPKAIWMHRVLLKTPNGLFTDHINGNPLDNRRQNLRNATRHENSRNRAKNKKSLSKYKGVHQSTDHKKWVAKITIYKTRMGLGTFLKERDAAMAYDMAAKEIFGEFAKLNFPLGASQ